MPQRAYSYFRFSHPSQAQGDSIRRQAEWAEQICRERGWCLDDTLRFADKGKSAFHGGLKALGQFLDLVECGRIAPGSVLIVEILDRLSREHINDAFDLFRQIIRAGITIATREPLREYSLENSGDPLSLLEPLFIFARAHEESAAKSMRTGEAWIEARKQAAQGVPIPSRPPAWVRKTACGYELIPERVETVRLVHRWCQSGHGVPGNRHLLENEGVRPIGRCGHWNDSSIASILKDRWVLGEYQPYQKINGKRQKVGAPIPGFYPAAITEDEWLRSRAAIASRRGRTGQPGFNVFNLFAGLAWDADTRKLLCVRSRHTKGRKYPYLASQRSRGTTYRYDEFERCVLRALAILRPEEVLDQPAQDSEREANIARLTAELVKDNDSHDAIRREIENPDNALAVPALTKSLTNIEAERISIAKKLNLLKTESLTGRAEALAAAQSLVEIRDGKAGKEWVELNRRIRSTLPSVISEIWVLAQKISERKQIVHVQIYLRSGQKRYERILPKSGLPAGVAPWELRDADFRAGNLGHVTLAAP